MSGQNFKTIQQIFSPFKDPDFTEDSMIDSLTKTGEIGPFTFKKNLSKSEIQEIIRLALQLKIFNFDSRQINNSSQQNWRDFFLFVQKSKLKELVFYNRKYSDFLNHTEQISQVPNYIVSKQFQSLVHLRFHKMDFTSSEFFSHIDAPLLQTVEIRNCPYIQLKSFHKTKFQHLSKLQIQTVVASSNQSLTRMRIDKKLIFSFLISEEKDIIIGGVQSLNYDLRFAAKFLPDVFYQALRRYRIKAQITETNLNENRVIENQRQIVQKELIHFKNHLCRMPKIKSQKKP